MHEKKGKEGKESKNTIEFIVIFFWEERDTYRYIRVFRNHLLKSTCLFLFFS